MDAGVARRRVGAALALLVVAAAILAVPARSYLAQRGELSDREIELAELERVNEGLAARLERMDDPEVVRQIARRDYGLVAVGEESYSILPPATAGLVLPRGWPFDRISGPLERAAAGGS